MLIRQIPIRNALSNYMYLLACEETLEAIAIDPLDHALCLQVAKELGWRIKTVANTHHHHDHAALHGARHGAAFWPLFAIFVLGPCEPLIPILMYPAATSSFWGLALVTGIFAIVTIGTMLMMVFLAQRGIRLIPMQRIERYTHAIAGVAILGSGLAIRFLGL